VYIFKGLYMNNHQSKKPMAQDEALSKPTNPCPICKSHMYISDIQCPHCGYELTTDEFIRSSKEYYSMSKKVVVFGVIFFTVFIITIILFSNFHGL